MLTINDKYEYQLAIRLVLALIDHCVNHPEFMPDLQQLEYAIKDYEEQNVCMPDLKDPVQVQEWRKSLAFGHIVTNPAFVLKPIEYEYRGPALSDMLKGARITEIKLINGRTGKTEEEFTLQK
jgi:hypothetical protein